MSKKKYYFAISDGCYDPETGETDEAGMIVAADEFETPEMAAAFVEQNIPSLAGRIRQITEEEYIRDFGDDE